MSALPPENVRDLTYYYTWQLGRGHPPAQAEADLRRLHPGFTEEEYHQATQEGSLSYLAGVNLRHLNADEPLMVALEGTPQPSETVEVRALITYTLASGQTDTFSVVRNFDWGEQEAAVRAALISDALDVIQRYGGTFSSLEYIGGLRYPNTRIEP